MRYSTIISLTAVLGLTATSYASIWVTSVPSTVQPYAIAHYQLDGYVVGQQIYRFPVTGPSSGNAFSLIQTNAPESGYLGVLPHLHQAHFETFFNYKGRFQLWANDQARLMTAGDFGAVPHNTNHTFQFLDLDSEMTGVIQPGGFEDLFYALASANYTANTYSPFDPSVADTDSSPPASVINSLEVFDVYGQLDYIPRRDLVNGSAGAPAGETWHTDSNALANDSATPYFIARGYGPKYLSQSQGYQVIQPLVTSTQSGGNFTMSTIAMDKLSASTVASNRTFAGHAAFEVLEGVLTVDILGETITLQQGDVVFIPGQTGYRYWSTVAYTKVLHVSQGEKGLDAELVASGVSWDSPVWPTTASNRTSTFRRK